MCVDVLRRWVRAHTYPRPTLRHMGASPVPSLSDRDVDRLAGPWRDQARTLGIEDQQ